MKITAEIKTQVIDLYNSRLSIRQIRDIIKISEPTISKILKSAGIPIRKDNYCKLNIDIAKANDLYSKGMSTYEIAEVFKCSDETIRNMITSKRSLAERNKRNADSLAKISKKSKDLWKDDEYRKKVNEAVNTPEYKKILSHHGKLNYGKSLGKWIKTDTAKQIISERAKDLWTSEAYRAAQQPYFQSRSERITSASVEALKDPDKRNAWIDKLKRSSTVNNTGGWISSTQRQLYYLLASSGISYIEEGHGTQVGPFYVVDCIIPVQQKMSKPLIIEVQGEYWHSLPHVMAKDRQKATYIKSNTNYDLLYLEELHMASFDEVKHKLFEFGLTIPSLEFGCKEVNIKSIEESVAKDFYAIFHYSSTIRKGAITFGAYYDDILVAAISYCYPLRKESADKLGCDIKQVLEISRMARRTNVISKNLMSYMLSNTIRRLPSTVKNVITFSDKTYGHTGGVYKAANFMYDGEIDADYHYISINGKYHKKTIWDRAKRMKMTESDYAEKHNLLKVAHQAKSRWLYKI